MEKPQITRPLSRYFGGKFRIAKWIISHFPDHKLYIEPFGGMASVLLLKKPAEAEFYNDINQYVVNLFRVLKDKELSKQLIDLIRLTPYARDELSQAIQDSDLEDPVIKAWAFVVKTYFSIGCKDKAKRSNFENRVGYKDSLTNHPRYWHTYPDSLYPIIDRLKNVFIENEDAIKLISGFSKDRDDKTLVYLDPPYVKATRVQKMGYLFEINDDYHIRLADVVKGSKMMFVVSGYKSDLYQDLYSDWKMFTTDAINLKNNHVSECIWVSPNVYEKLTRANQNDLFFCLNN